MTYTLRVTNTGNMADTFDVAVVGNTWTTTPPATVGPLAAGAGANVDVTVTIPVNAAVGATDTATITVTVQGDGTKADASTLTTTATALPANMILLTTGWNLASFNRALPDASVRRMLASVVDKLIVAQGYDGGGLSYYPGGAQNTLTSMDAQHGYWLKLTGAATLASIAGTKPATTTIPLQAGWNLVSYLPDTALARETTLASIAGKYTALLGYDHGAESWYAVLPDSMNTLAAMKPHRGYWLYMTEAATLAFP